jgi:hypothetical protein
MAERFFLLARSEGESQVGVIAERERQSQGGKAPARRTMPNRASLYRFHAQATDLEIATEANQILRKFPP